MIKKSRFRNSIRHILEVLLSFYLGSIGGPAAVLAKENITKVEVLDFEDLGMEAVWKIDVVDFPAFVVIDDKGNDFYASTTRTLINPGL